MKVFDDLTGNEKDAAAARELVALVEQVVGGEIRFNDEANNDDLQARIDAALDGAEKMQVPWFAHEFVLEDSFVQEALEGMASAQAQDAIYSEPHEYVRPVPIVG